MSRSQVTMLGVGLSLISAGCGHTSGAAGPREPAPQATATSSAADVPAPDASMSRAELNTLMQEHFAIAVWARDSLIDGALEAVRAPLRALSDYSYETFPLAWMGGIARLQASARQTANAATLEAAASGIAELAGICGRCHLDQGHVLPIRGLEIDTETPQSDGITTRMSRHAWAVERLWAGLVAPSDESWRAGAAALEHTPLRTPTPNSPAPRDFARDFAELRALGARARNENAPDMRVELYGRMLATCSRCHAQVDDPEQVRALSAQP